MHYDMVRSMCYEVWNFGTPFYFLRSITLADSIPFSQIYRSGSDLSGP